MDIRDNMGEFLKVISQFLIDLEIDNKYYELDIIATINAACYDSNIRTRVFPIKCHTGEYIIEYTH